MGGVSCWSLWEPRRLPVEGREGRARLLFSRLAFLLSPLCRQRISPTASTKREAGNSICTAQLVGW